MANGIPVIASNIAGLKDSVGEGGTLLEKDKVNEWIEKIQQLVSDKYFYMRMSKGAKEWVRDNYSEDEIINKSKNLIENTIKEFFLNNKLAFNS